MRTIICRGVCNNSLTSQKSQGWNLTSHLKIIYVNSTPITPTTRSILWKNTSWPRDQRVILTAVPRENDRKTEIWWNLTVTGGAELMTGDYRCYDLSGITRELPAGLNFWLSWIEKKLLLKLIECSYSFWFQKFLHFFCVWCIGIRNSFPWRIDGRVYIAYQVLTEKMKHSGADPL